MAKKTSLIPINFDIVDKLKFIKRTVGLVYREGYNTPYQLGGIHEIDQATYIKLNDKFFESDYNAYDIKSGDKVYIFPGCKIPMFKIKEYCKSIKATVTNDHTKATVFINTGKSFYTYDDYCEEFPTINYLVGKAVYYVHEHANNHEIRNQRAKYNERYKTFDFSSTDYHGLSFDKIITLGMYTSDSTAIDLNTFYFITPLFAEILYYSLANKIPFVSENSLYKAIPSSNIIDEELYLSLNSILSSNDEENHILAFQTIANCDYSASIKYLYHLYQDHGGKLMFPIYKNLKVFNNINNLRKLYDMDSAKFLNYMFENYNDQIDRSQCNRIFQEEAKSIVNGLSSDLVDIIIVPKPKFINLYDPDTSVKFEL